MLSRNNIAMWTADTGANSTNTADGEQIMGSEGTDKQQTDAVIQQEVRTSAAALQAATAAPQTPLELAASVATAVPGPHHLPSPAQDQASAGGPLHSSAVHVEGLDANLDNLTLV